MSISIEDKLSIHELVSRYGYLIDEKEFDRLGEIFTEDAKFEFVGFDLDSCDGLLAIQNMMHKSTQHPLAHHATNIVIDLIEGDLRVLSKGIGVGHNGRVGSVTYKDKLQKTDRGWRIKHRICELRQV